MNWAKSQKALIFGDVPVKTKSHCQIGRVLAKSVYQLRYYESLQRPHAIIRKPSHANGMVVLGFRQPRRCDVTI